MKEKEAVLPVDAKGRGDFFFPNQALIYPLPTKFDRCAFALKKFMRKKPLLAELSVRGTLLR